MNINNDYFKLYLERVKNINYLNDHIKDNNITLKGVEYISLFIIGEDNYYNELMSKPDRVFIESVIDFDEIELDNDDINKLLDLSTNYRIDKELNNKVVLECLDYYNKKYNKSLNIDNINRVLDTIK